MSKPPQRREFRRGQTMLRDVKKFVRRGYETGIFYLANSATKRYNGPMAAISPKRLAFTLCLLLVLPPGWCNVLAHCAGSQAAAEAPTCCHQTSDSATLQLPIPGCVQVPNGEEQLPLDPGSRRCCCQRRVLVVDDSLKISELADAHGLPAEVAVAAAPLRSPVPRTNGLLLSGKVRLHLLHCVWRC